MWYRVCAPSYSILILVTDECSSAALCQVYDSIFLDLPMSRVKFNVNTEYAYIQNFKILQSRTEWLRKQVAFGLTADRLLHETRNRTHSTD